MNKQIIWESQHLEIDTKYNTMKYASNKPDFFDNNEPEPEDFTELNNGMIVDTQQAQNIGMTPFGLFRVNDDMHPFKQFKLWMGHTNFNISQSVVKTIQDVEGVELLRVISRYRFIIGIGKAFDTLNVKRNIEHLLCEKTLDNSIIKTNNIHDETTLQKIKKITTFLEQYKKWSLLIFPNGNIEFITDQDKKFKSTSSAYREIENISSGIVLTK